MSGPKIAIIIYTLYGHIGNLAEAVKAGVEAAGGQATILQVAETLGPEILTLIKAPPKPGYPLAKVDDLALYDAFIFGIPTRFGNMPAQWKTFWDATGSLWFNGSLIGKYASLFVSSNSLGGGQESTAMSTMSTFAHHGLIYVPLGYGNSMSILTNLEEIHGGSPWGAGTFAGADGSRLPSKLEVDLAKNQGKHFYSIVAKAFKA
ncbi:flavodoxin-like fold protein [Leucoagaricus gongylophorus]